MSLSSVKSYIFSAVIGEIRSCECPSLYKTYIEYLGGLKIGNTGMSIPWEVLLKTTLQEHKHMPNLILKGRTAHLTSNNHFAKNVNQYKTTSYLQL